MFTIKVIHCQDQGTESHQSDILKKLNQILRNQSELAKQINNNTQKILTAIVNPTNDQIQTLASELDKNNSDLQKTIDEIEDSLKS